MREHDAARRPVIQRKGLNMPINREDLQKYFAGDDLPPATERQVSDELTRRPELRALVQLTGDVTADDEIDIDPDLFALAEQTVDELWDSRVALLTLSESRWPMPHSPVATKAIWGAGLGETALTLSHNGQRVEIRGEWPSGIRPLSLLLCDYNFLGEPGSAEAKSRESAGKVHRLKCDTAPSVARDDSTTELAKSRPKSLSLSSELRNGQGHANRGAPIIKTGTCELEVPWFPERDEHTHSEVLVVVNRTHSTLHPFHGEREGDWAYLKGSVPDFLPKDNLENRVEVSVRTLIREDWPQLSSELASLALSQAVPIPRTLEPIEGGYALDHLDSGAPDEADKPETAWLIRYMVEKGGE
jgi:hypothetical protein